MKKIALLSVVLMFASITFAQKYITKNGHIKFYSETPMETIEAHNKQVNSALDIKTGDFVFKVLMKSFEFEKALMQEHFNENYVESDKFPNASFKGKIHDIEKIDFSSGTTVEVMVEGDLTIHGVTKRIGEKGTLKLNGDVVEGEATFIIRPDEYDIKIPSTVMDNIAEKIEVTVTVKMEKYEKK